MEGDGVASGIAPDEPGETSALQDVVLDSSRTLMSAHPDEFDTKLSWTLGSVGEAFGADRCGTYQVESGGDGSTLVLTHEWTADGTSGHDEGTRVLGGEALPWLFERLQGFQIARASPTRALPGEATALRASLEAAGVRSALYVPLVSNWSLLGAVSFEAVAGSVAFDDERTRLAKTFGDMVGHAIAQTRRERELRRQNDRLQQFASVVSHDLRNPLNVTKASIDLARDGRPEEHLDRAADAADRMERIVEQVLTLARMGQDIGETESVLPGEVAEDAWTSIRADQATLDTTTLDTTAGDRIEADRERLRQALENLFNNAIQHGGRDVAVRVGPLPDRPGFYVEDDGAGIPEAERDDVLEHGFSTSDDGTGLGLSIVSRIAEAHGWAIDVGASDTGGARFEFRTEPDRGVSG